MSQRLVGGNRVVLLSDRRGIPGAGGRQCFKTEMGQYASTSDIPWIGNDKRAVAFMERTKSFSFFSLSHLAPHINSLWRVYLMTVLPACSASQRKKPSLECDFQWAVIPISNLFQFHLFIDRTCFIPFVLLTVYSLVSIVRS